MSDFDRNLAARGSFGAGRAVAVDAGLRAHMLRVYNYMAIAVALTGGALRRLLQPPIADVVLSYQRRRTPGRM